MSVLKKGIVLAGLGLTMLTAGGCQTWNMEAGVTLPTGEWLIHPPQFFPPTPPRAPLQPPIPPGTTPPCEEVPDIQTILRAMPRVARATCSCDCKRGEARPSRPALPMDFNNSRRFICPLVPFIPTNVRLQPNELLLRPDSIPHQAPACRSR